MSKKIIGKYSIVSIFLCGWSLAEDGLTSANNLAESLVRLPPEEASSLVFGHKEKLYPNTEFWLSYQLAHPFHFSSKQLVENKVVAVTILYSVNSEVNIPSSNQALLLVVNSSEGWKALPSEYLELYLERGEKATEEKMIEDVERLPFPDDFPSSFAKALKQRREAELEQVNYLMESFRSKEIPLDKVTDPPRGSYQIRK